MWQSFSRRGYKAKSRSNGFVDTQKDKSTSRKYKFITDKYIASDPISDII